jgi:hypothetical protein
VSNNLSATRTQSEASTRHTWLVRKLPQVHANACEHQTFVTHVILAGNPILAQGRQFCCSFRQHACCTCLVDNSLTVWKGGSASMLQQRHHGVRMCLLSCCLATRGACFRFSTTTSVCKVCMMCQHVLRRYVTCFA